MDLARAPRRAARKKGSGYENELGQDAIDKQITSEKFEQFSERVKSTTMNLSKSTMN